MASSSEDGAVDAVEGVPTIIRSIEVSCTGVLLPGLMVSVEAEVLLASSSVSFP